MSKLHVMYRSYPGDKPEVRPAFYKREICQHSLQRAIRYCGGEVGDDWSFTLFYDWNSVPIELAQEIRVFGGDVQVIGGLGNKESCKHVYNVATELPSDDWVYFAEDDYLYPKAAFLGLREAAGLGVAEYVTLYDHPARYNHMIDELGYEPDLPNRVNNIWLTPSADWRPQESTCMTYAGKVGALKEDSELFHHWVDVPGKNAPQDRDLFRHLQGLQGYEDGSPQRLLIGPLPSLATHCHEPWLALHVDWEMVANSVEP